jgi:hypothetical protein
MTSDDADASLIAADIVFRLRRANKAPSTPMHTSKPHKPTPTPIHTPVCTPTGVAIVEKGIVAEPICTVVDAKVG